MEFAERLGVPLRWWVQGTMLIATFWLAIVVIEAIPLAVVWALTGVALASLAAMFWAYGSARIVVRDGVLQAGRARISTDLLGTVTALDTEDMRAQAGRDADARAYLLIRPYLKRGVRVDLTDPEDPTPYWLLSTRRPHELAASLGGRRDGQGDGA